MYHCTFLVNRQMITEPSQIKASLDKYISVEDGKPISDIQYRLEWYRIGISIPMDVYCSKRPSMQLRPECQITEIKEFEVLRGDVLEVNFKIFVIPFKNTEKNEELEEDFLKKWFTKQLKKSAAPTEIKFGPNNRIYYRAKAKDSGLSQIQSYSLSGKLRVIDSEKLEKIISAPVGYYSELGCGLLLLD